MGYIDLMKKIAVILSGCGFLDGAEITESVSTLIALDQKDCKYEVFAPDVKLNTCLLYTSPSPRDQRGSRMPSSA